MSRIWSGEEMGAAERLNSWSEMSAAGASSSGFRALYADESGSRAWNITQPGHPSMGSRQANQAPQEAAEDPVEAAAREAFVQGFQEGERVTREAAQADDKARLALANALALVAEGGEGTLASLLSHAVIRLVGQIVGEVAIDEALLQERCTAVAACIDSDAGRATLEVHPDDMPLIDPDSVGMALTPNPALPRGSVRLATSEGWVEDGPDVRLSRLKAMLDGLEGRP